MPVGDADIQCTHKVENNEMKNERTKREISMDADYQPSIVLHRHRRERNTYNSKMENGDSR